MKKIVFGILVGSLIFFTGCLDDDGYSSTNQWVGFGVLQNTDNYWIKMDSGEMLKPVTFDHPGYWDQISETRDGLQAGDRIFVNFTILDDNANDTSNVVTYYVKVNSVEEILLKQIMDITPENEDSIGNDPIIVKDVWVANDMVNFKIKYRGESQMHYINLVKQPGELTAENQPFQLQLRHNSNNDNKTILYSAYVSFHLDSLRLAGQDSVWFNVTCVDYDGDPFEYEGVYKYNYNVIAEN